MTYYASILHTSQYELIFVEFKKYKNLKSGHNAHKSCHLCRDSFK